MSHKAPGQGTVAGDMSVADAVWEELWQGVGVGLGVSQSSERVFPQPSRQKAPGSQQEPSSRSPGTAPSLTSAPSLPQRLVMSMGAAKVPHGNRAGHSKKGGQHPRGKASAGGNEWDECERATSTPPIPHQGAGTFLGQIQEDIQDHPCLGQGCQGDPGGISVQLCVLGHPVPCSPQAQFSGRSHRSLLAIDGFFFQEVAVELISLFFPLSELL